MKLKELINNPFYLVFQSLLALLLGMYLELSKIQQSFLLLTLNLIMAIWIRQSSPTRGNNYDSKLFGLIDNKDPTKFIEYIEANFKEIKEVENLIYYGKMNALLYALGGKNYEVCKILLQKGYNVNFHNDFCEVPLIYAIHYSDLKMVELILEYNPDLELRSLKIKSTPLETAIYRNRKQIVEKLLNRGAKFSLASYKTSICNELTPWENVKISIKKAILKFSIFERKKNMFNIYDKSMNKEVKLKIFNTRHYFMENCLSM